MKPRKKSLWPPLAILLAIYAAVAAADWIAPYDFHEQNRELPLAPPSRLRFVDAEGTWHPRPFVYRLRERPDRLGEYVEDEGEIYPLRFFVRHRLFGVDEGAHVALLGTDRFGRDQLSRLLHGGRVSLGAGLLAGLIAVGLGLAVGTAAGYYGGVVDTLAMRLGELFMAFPWLFLLIAVRAFLPLDLTPTETFAVIVAVIGVLGWVRPARLVRGVVLSARERDYVHAARGFGGSDLYLLWRHVLPQTRNVLLTHLALAVPRFVLAEVTLSFLGLGTPEPVPSWGNMLAVLQQYHILVSSWWMSIPAAALVGVILSYHHLASRLQKHMAATTAL